MSEQFTIPDDATPADVVGDLELLPGQDWLDKRALIHYTSQMRQGIFPWDETQEEEPLSIQEGSNGRVINQGHHRIVAAKIAGTDIPVRIEVLRDYWPGRVPFARRWNDVVWQNSH